MLLLALDLVSYPFMGQFTLANFGHTQFKATQTLDIDKSSLVCPFDFRLKMIIKSLIFSAYAIFISLS